MVPWVPVPQRVSRQPTPSCTVTRRRTAGANPCHAWRCAVPRGNRL